MSSAKASAQENPKVRKMGLNLSCGEGSIKRLKTEKPLTNLLLIAEKACFILARFVQEVYARLHEEKISTRKADKSYFSIADSLVQHMILILFPLDKFKEHCGEESAKLQVSKRPYKVGKMEVPDDLAESFERTRKEIDALIPKVDSEKYKDIGVFVDPIDGTKEFCTKLGEQCSICIGFTRDSKPVAGIVFRPIPHPDTPGKLTYMAGCKEEMYTNGILDQSDGKTSPSIVTTNGSISNFTEGILKELDFVRCKAGGCGNKMLLLLEGKGTLYIQDRGVSRWDTCAAQAVLEACGGVLSKLTSVADNRKYEPYRYTVGEINVDFNPLAKLTRFNSKNNLKDLNSTKPVPQITPENLAPYSNVCGLFASHKTDPKLMNQVMDAIQKVAKVSKPSYN
ncbi:hypothetical protein AAMO2058_001028400 [Amorphochlora amoebiformis]